MKLDMIVAKQQPIIHQMLSGILPILKYLLMQTHMLD